jgi:hypothetical protein
VSQRTSFVDEKTIGWMQTASGQDHNFFRFPFYTEKRKNEENMAANAVTLRKMLGRMRFSAASATYIVNDQGMNGIDETLICNEGSWSVTTT